MNILHRDLKTQNIFLTKNNDIRIGDLGIAKQLLRFRFTNTVIGTPYYLSPEICKNKPYNEKSDIWALGCVLYELCTFNHPFESTNQASLIKKILEQNPKPIPSTFDSNFNLIVKQLLQKEKRWHIISKSRRWRNRIIQNGWNSNKEDGRQEISYDCIF